MSQVLLETKHTPLPIGENGMTQYLQEIRQFPRLTQEQELVLAKRCAEGDEEAIRQMVNSNLRLVVSLARQYAGRGIPLLDLIQEGSIGLLTAAKKFDYTQQCRFSTYATKWIQQGIGRYLLNHEGLIRVPRHTAELMRRLRVSRAALTTELGREPKMQELTEHSGIPKEKIQQLELLLPQVCSLDAPASEEENSTLHVLLQDMQAPQPQQELVRRELKSIMDSLLEGLNERQRQVLRLHFGLEDGVCYSLEQIGRQLGVSKERARQIERQAMDKLQKLGQSFGLEDFLE